MKSSTPISILAIAATAMAEQKPRNFVYVPDASVPQPEADQMCVQFNSGDTWYYTLSGSWGSSGGQGTSLGYLCLPTNTNGAMFIGPDANPGPGSTKFECYFPDSGTANCDVSLVDGYSISMGCGVSGQTQPIGGSVNLYDTGIACPDQQGPNCINTNAYNVSSQSGVAEFFQPATENGNSYCIWDDCSQDSYFDVSNPLSCQIFS